MTWPEAFELNALRFCNKLRKMKEKKPLKRLPKGIREDSHSCPCGKAAGIDICMDIWSFRNETEENITPYSVSEFIRRFDRGLYPHLELKP